MKALILLCGIGLFLSLSQAEDPLSPEPMSTISREHPRLLASAREWQQQVSRTRTDPQLKRLAAHLESQADALLETPPVTREVTGRRLLSVSRDVLRRVLQLVSAYHFTGNEAYARRAEQELLAVAAFSDWNPSHFLDVAEMTTAVAIGYDELYEELSPATRGTLRQAIVQLGILPGSDPAHGWHRSHNNWNQVCLGGITLGALAIAEHEPDLARQVLKLARTHIGAGLEPYAPDGLYPEGPGYWGYGTTYQVIMIEALRHALGDDWNLPASPGFLPSATVLSQLTGPTGMSYNFSDGWESVGFQPAQFWFAKELGQPSQLIPHRANIERWLQDSGGLGGDRFTALAFLWWVPVPASADPGLPLAWRSHGDQPVAVMRSSWTDPAATFLAVKAGSPTANHGHMDAGSFILEADGVRWARDLGAQSYHSLESKGINLWNSAQDADRWRVFRLNNRSHNTLVIDDQLQHAAGHATITRDAFGPESFVTLDLAPVYPGQVATARRGFRLDRHKRVLVQDEITGLNSGADVRWAMVTAADITLAPDGRSARLTQDGQSLEVALLAPGTSQFTAQSAEPPEDDFNVSNPDRRMLVLHTSAPTTGNLRISIIMTPGSISAEAPAPKVLSLSDW